MEEPSSPEGVGERQARTTGRPGTFSRLRGGVGGRVGRRVGRRLGRLWLSPRRRRPGLRRYDRAGAAARGGAGDSARRRVHARGALLRHGGTAVVGASVTIAWEPVLRQLRRVGRGRGPPWRRARRGCRGRARHRRGRARRRGRSGGAAARGAAGGELRGRRRLHRGRGLDSHLLEPACGRTGGRERDAPREPALLRLDAGVQANCSCGRLLIGSAMPD